MSLPTLPMASYTGTATDSSLTPSSAEPPYSFDRVASDWEPVARAATMGAAEET